MRSQFEAEQGFLERALVFQRQAIALTKQGRFLVTSWCLIQFFDTAKALGRATDPKMREAVGVAIREMYEALRSLVTRVYGPKSAEMVILRTTEGRFLYDRGDRTEADKCFTEARALLAGVPDIEPSEANTLLYWSGALEMDRGEFAKAERCFRDALALTKRMPEQTVGDRKEDAIQMANALVALGRFAEAVPFLDLVRRLKEEQKLPEKELAMAYLQVAECQCAAGDLSGYQKTLDQMFRLYGKSADVNILVRLAWATGLGTAADPRTVELETRFATAFGPTVSFPWGYRGLALLRLRAGKFDAVEPAIARAGKTAHAVDHALRGLMAVERGDRVAARDHLTKAEALAAIATPTAEKPFPFAGASAYPWNQHVETAILITELRAALAPPVAPAPRPRLTDPKP
jgi:tetratricopeptide (TPR) repeat protein